MNESESWYGWNNNAKVSQLPKVLLMAVYVRCLLFWVSPLRVCCCCCCCCCCVLLLLSVFDHLLPVSKILFHFPFFSTFSGARFHFISFRFVLLTSYLYRASRDKLGNCSCKAEATAYGGVSCWEDSTVTVIRNPSPPVAGRTTHYVLRIHLLCTARFSHFPYKKTPLNVKNWE